MHKLMCSSICMLMLIGCASSPPAPTAAAPTATTATAAPTQQELDKQRAERLINYSVESGEPINTADGKKIICKQESVTNTRLKNKKICLTEAEWLARSDNAKDGFQDAKRAGEYLPADERTRR